MPQWKQKYIKGIRSVIKNKHNKIFLKNLNRDHNNNKNSHHSNREKKRHRGRSRTNYRTNQNIRIIINVFLGSQLSASLLSASWVAHSNPAVSHCPQPTSASFGGPPILSGGGLWTCCGSSLDSNLAPTPVCSCLQCPQLPELWCVFYGYSHCPFTHSIDTEPNYLIMWI